MSRLLDYYYFYFSKSLHRLSHSITLLLKAINYGLVHVFTHLSYKQHSHTSCLFKPKKYNLINHRVSALTGASLYSNTPRICYWFYCCESCIYTTVHCCTCDSGSQTIGSHCKYCILYVHTTRHNIFYFTIITMETDIFIILY